MSDIISKDASQASNGTRYSIADVLHLLHLPQSKREHSPIKNANEVHNDQLTPLERLASKITDKIGSMGFFFLIFLWTITWCGFNIVASEVPRLHWKPFDPFPAFVAYLLISNVIQILLMPLIMVGQNVQARHSEIRAELDFEINKKAEKEVTDILHRLEHNTNLLLHLMKHLECTVTKEELALLSAETELTAKIEALQSRTGNAALATD